MADLNLEKVLAEIRTLSPDEQEQLRRLLNGSVISSQQDELPIKPRIIGTYTPKDRSKENDWLAKNQNQFAGQWLALDGDQLLGHGFLLKDVMVEVEKKGITDALVVRAELSAVAPYMGF